MDNPQTLVAIIQPTVWFIIALVVGHIILFKLFPCAHVFFLHKIIHFPCHVRYDWIQANNEHSQIFTTAVVNTFNIFAANTVSWCTVWHNNAASVTDHKWNSLHFLKYILPLYMYLPDCKPSNGTTRCAISLSLSSTTPNLRRARSGKTTW